MKNFLKKSFIIFLSALLFVGCQKDEDPIPEDPTPENPTPENPTPGEEPADSITISAFINSIGYSRVAYQEAETELKVKWNDSGESFVVVRQHEYKIFTQKPGSTSEFEADVLPGETGDLKAYYPAAAYSEAGWNIDFSSQSSNLDDKLCLMTATGDTQNSFTFSHMTSIIKPTFKINDAKVSKSSISKIVLKQISNVRNMSEIGDITVTIPTGVNNDDIYIYIPQSNISSTEIYATGAIINVDVYVNENGEEKLYLGNITVPADKPIVSGKVYPIDITISAPVPAPETCQLPDGTTFNTLIKENISGISSIKFVPVSTISNLSGAVKIGESEAYLYKNGLTLEIHTAAKKFQFNSDCTGMFSGLADVTSIDFNNCINTSQVTIMQTMFGTSGFTTLDLSCFDTSNVTIMQGMFISNANLTSVDVSSFNTSKVTNMLNMFNKCTSLTSLNLSNFDTKSVTTMLNMFSGSSNLVSINVSSFDTSNVTDMKNMFGNLSKLQSLDLSNFKTANVTLMTTMFANCNVLETLDIRNFTFADGVNTNNMFNNLGKSLVDKKTKVIVKEKLSIPFVGDAKAVYVDINGNEFTDSEVEPS